MSMWSFVSHLLANEVVGTEVEKELEEEKAEMEEEEDHVEEE